MVIGRKFTRALFGSKKRYRDKSRELGLYLGRNKAYRQKSHKVSSVWVGKDVIGRKLPR